MSFSFLTAEFKYLLRKLHNSREADSEVRSMNTQQLRSLQQSSVLTCTRVSDGEDGSTCISWFFGGEHKNLSNKRLRDHFLTHSSMKLHRQFLPDFFKLAVNFTSPSSSPRNSQDYHLMSLAASIRWPRYCMQTPANPLVTAANGFHDLWRWERLSLQNTQESVRSEGISCSVFDFLIQRQSFVFFSCYTFNSRAEKSHWRSFIKYI